MSLKAKKNMCHAQVNALQSRCTQGPFLRATQAVKITSGLRRVERTFVYVRTYACKYKYIYIYIYMFVYSIFSANLQDANKGPANDHGVEKGSKIS